ncbi:MAG: sugar ABC transporter ATP-binding protein [Desulfobacterales bacterium]|nr:MAG: sugar ABC transporter ATP-binding protein [Desulfobacterales bacterium]
MAQAILEMKSITKNFPGVRAVDKVDFSCVSGEVHALVGENGAGKSTLMKILAGAYPQDEGSIRLKNRQIHMASPHDAQRHGISIIYQEFNLIPDLTVADNVFLGREPKKHGLIDKRRISQLTEKLLSQLDVKIDPYERARNLSVAEQQMVEVAKALSLNADIIIMDEPSAVVSGKELDALFGIIRSLKQAGKLIIYISHRLAEIFEIADRVTVLKDGRLVDTIEIANVDKQALIRMMVGRSLDETFPPKKRGPVEEIVVLKNVRLTTHREPLNLTIRSGEILGVAGLVGSGRTALARAIFGADPIEEGEIVIQGESFSRLTPRIAISEGIGFVTEDRKKEGVVHCLPVKNNLTFPILNRIHKLFFVKDDEEKAICARCIEQFNIRTPTLDQLIRYLSGGNQQKVIIAKWINAQPRLIIMDEPTRGIDVGAKAEIYNLMRRLATEGTGIMMISSELPEIIGLSDRILVMHQGRVAGELSPQDATEEEILSLATGQTKPIHASGAGQ